MVHEFVSICFVMGLWMFVELNMIEFDKKKSKFTKPTPVPIV